MPQCFFVSDLHGSLDRYEKLFSKIENEKPNAVFWGGDLLPSGIFAFAKNQPKYESFVNEYLIPQFQKLKSSVGPDYPKNFIIMGNDDGRNEEDSFLKGQSLGLWEYVHFRKVQFHKYHIFGYSFVPPTPFLLKDWEKYDVSRYVDPGCLSPEEGWRSIPVEKEKIRYSTIQKDLETLAGRLDHSKSIFLFHTPPYQTCLDRAALDGKKIDHVPLDVNVGSIAVKRFIENRQPLITLHGHIHESTRLTGSWKEKLGNTWAFSAAHNGPELALVRFDPDFPEKSTREII